MNLIGGILLLFCHFLLTRTQQTLVFEPSTITMYAGQKTECGYIELAFSEDGSEICVTYHMYPGFTLSQVHLDFGFSLNYFPLNKKGNIQVGRLRFQKPYDPPVTTAGPFTRRISDIEEHPSDLCDTTLRIGAHAVVTGAMVDNGGLITTETAWANPTPQTKNGGSWGGLTTTQIKCPDDSSLGEPNVGGDFVDDCETSWGRYMSDDTTVTRRTFKQDDIGDAWGWFQCTKVEGSYVSTMIAAQFYDTGRMHWSYSCDNVCQVKVDFEMRNTCGTTTDRTSIQEVQVRVGIVTEGGTYQDAIISKNPGNYEKKETFTSSFPKIAGPYVFTEGCFQPSIQPGKPCDIRPIQPGDEICVSAHLNACYYCEDAVLTQRE